MKIIYELNEAIQECKKYLKNDILPTTKLNSSFMPPTDLIHSGPWEMSIPALKNTLEYINHFLHHSCYVLCSDGKKSTLFKLESQTTAPTFKAIIKKELKTLDSNTHLSDTQKAFIRNYLKDDSGIRILQCIVKKIKKETTTTKEYEKFIEGIPLPSGVYIMNLTDANLLHKKDIEPFPIYRGNQQPLPPPTDKPFLPILSLSGNKKYYDIPIPNYDDVSYILGLAKYDIRQFKTKWTEKLIDKAVFRGGPSGCGYTIETNQRLRLIHLKGSSKDLDVGIVSEKNTIDSNSIRFDPVYGLGMLNTGIKSSNRLNYVEQSNYKYIIHVDGNVNAYRLLSIMATGSLIIRVRSSFTSWFEHLIEPGKHFVEVKSDLSDLLEKVQWCKKNDSQCLEMASRSLKFAQNILLNPEYVKGAFQKTVFSIFDNSVSKESPLTTIKPAVIKTAKKTMKIKEPDESFYIKDENEKKCKKGYLQDKKDKTKCNKTNVKQVEPIEPIIKPLKIKEMKEVKEVKEKIQSPIMAQPLVQPKITSRVLSFSTNSPKTKKHKPTEYRVESVDDTETDKIRRKCDSIKNKIADIINQ